MLTVADPLYFTTVERQHVLFSARARTTKPSPTTFLVILTNCLVSCSTVEDTSAWTRLPPSSLVEAVLLLEKAETVRVSEVPMVSRARWEHALFVSCSIALLSIRPCTDTNASSLQCLALLDSGRAWMVLGVSDYTSTATATRLPALDEILTTACLIAALIFIRVSHA